MAGTKTLFSKVRSLAAGKIKSFQRRGDGELKLARRKLAEKNEKLKKFRAQLQKKDLRIARLSANSGARDVESQHGFRPENIVWIFCTGRSGSTWLGSMMGDFEGHEMWNEPLVGQLFGEFFYVRAAHKKGNKFILGPRYRNVWMESIRSLVLEGSAARYPELADEGCLVIKEPHGSMGAPLMVEAVPESRMVFLVRDPRDVASSALDAHRKGSWTSQHNTWNKSGKSKAADTDPDDFIRRRAKTYLQDIEKSWEAYEAHEGPKTLVRYEGLRADTLGTMRRIYTDLEIEVDEAELARVVEKYSWENIPEEDKGQGKFYRKATPGGWREDLTEKQVKKIEEITAPLLEKFYPE